MDYVEAYAGRLEAQEAGLRSIESAVVRTRADARDLIRAAEAAGRGRGETREQRQSFFADQFQGVASATGELAERLEREEEAATAGAVLHASWASHGALDLPLPELGPEGAMAFARKVEGLYARFQARTNQLTAERRAVQRLLDMLIERQLAQRLDSLFAGGDAIGLGSLLSGEGKSQDWQDLGAVVSRTLGLPSGAVGVGLERCEKSLVDVRGVDIALVRAGHVATGQGSGHFLVADRSKDDVRRDVRGQRDDRRGSQLVDEMSHGGPHIV